jgi:hypothetical protein
MRKSLLSRVKRLENNKRVSEKKLHIIFVQPGETKDEAQARYFADKPQAEPDDLVFILNFGRTPELPYKES